MFSKYCSLGSPCFLFLPYDIIKSIEQALKKWQLQPTLFDVLADLIKQRWHTSGAFWHFFKSALASAQTIYYDQNDALPVLAEELFSRLRREFDADAGWELAHEPRRNAKVKSTHIYHTYMYMYI